MSRNYQQSDEFRRYEGTMHGPDRADNEPAAKPGCGAESPNGYRCTHHFEGSHHAHGTEPGSWADSWPIARATQEDK